MFPADSFWFFFFCQSQTLSLTFRTSSNQRRPLWPKILGPATSSDRQPKNLPTVGWIWIWRPFCPYSLCSLLRPPSCRYCVVQRYLWNNPLFATAWNIEKQVRISHSTNDKASMVGKCKPPNRSLPLGLRHTARKNELNMVSWLISPKSPNIELLDYVWKR